MARVEEVMKRTQFDRIIAYLKRHKKATTWELSQAARSLNVHKRLSEHVTSLGWAHYRWTGSYGVDEWVEQAALDTGHMIERKKVKRGSVWVTQYTLVRA